MILVIGSSALNQHCYRRKPLDLDLLMTDEDLRVVHSLGAMEIFPTSASHYVGTVRDELLEVHLAHKETDLELLEAHQNSNAEVFLSGTSIAICELNWLYALKISHRYKKDSPHFLKTMRDIEFMKELGAEIPCKDWLRRRTAETLARHPKLNQSKARFFDTPGVLYKYDHDTLHLAMALGQAPAYTQYVADGQEVQCSKQKWEETSKETKLNGVLEEALVLALERSQIPYEFSLDQSRSFEIALTKVCTSITSGWFRAWAYEHYDEVMGKFETLPWNYVERFHTALRSGIIKEAS